MRLPPSALLPNHLLASTPPCPLVGMLFGDEMLEAENGGGVAGEEEGVSEGGGPGFY